MPIEKRSFKLETREQENGHLTGHAAVFNEWTPPMFGFRERIAEGAFNRALAEKHDVRALWNHDANMVLGRTKSGTLSLSLDERGLLVDIDPPDTQWAKDCRTSIRRKDVDQMSFAMKVKKDEWDYDEEADIVSRTILDVELFDVAPVTYPAYAGTDISARGAGDMPQSLMDKVSEVRNAANNAESGDEAAWEDSQECYDLRTKQLDLLLK